MRRRFMESHATALMLIAVILSGAAALAVIYTRGYTGGGGPIRGDVIGYYIYLPAAFLDRDVSLVRTVDRSFDGEAEEHPQ